MAYRRKSYGSRSRSNYGRKRVYGKSYGKRTSSRGRSSSRKSSQQTVRIVIQQPQVSPAPANPFQTQTQKKKAKF